MKRLKFALNASHQEVWELLPWFITDTLDVRERRRVQTHLKTCPACRSELEEQRRVNRAVRQPDEVGASPEASFAKLMNRIDAAETQGSSTPSKPTSMRFHLPDIFTWWRDVPLGARQLLVAQTATILLLAGGVVMWSTISDQTQVYQTLSDAKEGVVADQLQFRLVLEDTLTTGEMRELLQSVHANVVDGPSASGVFTITVPLDGGDMPEVASLSARLRGQKGVRLAEPVLHDQHSGPY